MSTTYNQTDTGATDDPDVACSGATAIVTTASSQCQVGGALGTGTHSVTCPANISRYMIDMESPPNDPGLMAWTGGNLSCTLNVTTGNANIQWTELWVCRVNSSGVSQATVGSLTGQTTVLTTGVYTFHVTCTAQGSTASTDRWYLVLVFKNTAGTSQSITVKFNQTVVTPFLNIIDVLPVFGSGRANRNRRRRSKQRQKKRINYAALFPGLGPPLQLANYLAPRRRRRKKKPNFQRHRHPYPTQTPKGANIISVQEQFSGKLSVVEQLSAKATLQEQLSGKVTLQEGLSGKALTQEQLTATARTVEKLQV